MLKISSPSMVLASDHFLMLPSFGAKKTATSTSQYPDMSHPAIDAALLNNKNLPDQSSSQRSDLPRAETRSDRLFDNARNAVKQVGEFISPPEHPGIGPDARQQRGEKVVDAAGGLGGMAGRALAKRVKVPGTGVVGRGILSGAKGMFHGLMGTGEGGALDFKKKLLERHGVDNPWMALASGRTGAVAGAGIGALMAALHDEPPEYDEYGRAVQRQGIISRMLGGAVKGVLPGVLAGLAAKHFVVNPAMKNITINDGYRDLRVVGGSGSDLRLQGLGKNDRVFTAPVSKVREEMQSSRMNTPPADKPTAKGT